MTSLHSGRPIVLGPVHLVVWACYKRGMLHATWRNRGIVFPCCPVSRAFPEHIFPCRERMVRVSCCLSRSRATGEPESRVFPCGFAGRLTRRNLCVKPGLTRRGLRASHHHWRGTVEPTTGRGGRCERVEEDEPELSASEHA